jgi:hypothetical protein
MAQTLRRPLNPLCTTFLLAALLCAGLHAAEEPPPKRPTAAQIIRAAEALGSHDRAKRIAAEALLRRAGPAALSALAEAAQNPDRITAARAEAVMEPIRLGISPDTPEDVAALARSYPDATHEVRLEILTKLMTHGEHGLRVVRAMAMSDCDKEALKKASWNWHSRVEGLIHDCKFVEAEALLWMATTRTILHPPPRNREEYLAYGSGPEWRAEYATPNLAAFLAIDGRAAEAIAEVAGWQSVSKLESRAWLLAHLLETQARYQEAAQAATFARKPDMIRKMMLMGRDWPGLAQRIIKRASEKGKWSGHTARQVAQLAYLAGDDKLLDKALAELRRANRASILFQRRHNEGLTDANDGYAAFVNQNRSALLAVVERDGSSIDPDDDVYAMSNLEMFLIMGRAADIKRLDSIILKQIVEQHKPAPDVDDVQRAQMEMGLQRKLAKFHFDRGHDEEARKRLRQAAEIATKKCHDGFHRQIARTARSFGMHDLARELFVGVISRATYHNERHRLLAEAVNGDPTEAVAWWRFLPTQYPDEEPVAILTRVERIIAGDLPKEELVPLTQAFIKAVKQMAEADVREGWAGNGTKKAVPARVEATHLAALARTCARYKMTDLAVQCLKRAIATTGEVSENAAATHGRQLGVVLFEAERWTDSADILNPLARKGKVWGADLFVSGVASVRAGRKLEGERLMMAARLYTQSTAQYHALLACAMDWYGPPREAERQRILKLRVNGPSGSNSLQDTMKLQMESAARDGEWTRFRKLAEQQFATIFLTFNRMTRYHGAGPLRRIRARNAIRVGRTGELLDAGKKADAVQLAHRIVDELPLASREVIHLVQVFDQAGMQEEADELFEKSNAAFLAVSKVLPGRWDILNNWAWTAGQCERDLDNALVTARKAVAIAPPNKSEGTLAAVHIARKEYHPAAAILRRIGPANAKNCRLMGQVRIALKRAEK